MNIAQRVMNTVDMFKYVLIIEYFLDVFICVNNYIACMEQWADEDSKITAVEVKGRDTKFMWKIVLIFRALNEDM
jgi:hypothetical protein